MANGLLRSTVPTAFAAKALQKQIHYVVPAAR